jgi:hypothetical protein
MLAIMKNLAGVNFDRVAGEQMSKARLLRPAKPEEDDPNIAAAMNPAAGKPPAPESLSERLAALQPR